MKKKILVVCLLIALVLVPATAASYKGATKNNTLGLGLNVGTNSGLGLKAGIGKSDIIADLGFGALNFDFSIDAAYMYEVASIKLNNHNSIPVTVGGGANVGIDFKSFDSVNVGVFGMAGLEYTFKDVPINLYGRLGLGLNLGVEGDQVDAGFGWMLHIGALYMFDI